MSVGLETRTWLCAYTAAEEDHDKRWAQMILGLPLAHSNAGRRHRRGDRMKAPTLDHRRHAIQVAAGLPEDCDDSLVILDLARQLVVDFLQADAAAPIKAPVVTLIRGRPDLSA
jgi:hypothetical protein